MTVNSVSAAPMPEREAPATRADSSPAHQRSEPTTLIEASSGWSSLRLRELWQYRELLYFLIWRDLKIRYKQTALGISWAVIQPLTTMIIFSVIFGRLAGLPSDGVPYPIFAFAGLLPWTFFAGALGRAGTSLVGSATLIRKVYFPRLVIPISAVTAGVVDLGVASLLLFGLMVFYGIVPTAAIIFLPLFVLIALVTVLGVSLWLSALNVRYRDVGFLIPFMAQIWMYASPVAYTSSLVPDRWLWLYGMNPMAGVIDGFRWALLGSKPPSLQMLTASVLVALVLVSSGAVYFRRMERTFSDVI